MSQIHKRIGTLLPMSALVSQSRQNGSFAAGEQFVGWLAKTKQNAWQMLPLHETQLERGSSQIHVPSPYKGYGIGLDPRYLNQGDKAPSAQELREFRTKNSFWVEEYALFIALKDYFGSDNFSTWPKDIRTREMSALCEYRTKLWKQIESEVQRQAQLHIAYAKLQNTAKINDVLLIGDMPFYLGMNSPLVWQYQTLFELNEYGQARRVSGVLPGPKSHFGRQVWGHPLYNWQERANWDGLTKVFELRIGYLASIYNLVRLDHAKGLFSYCAISLDHPDLDTTLKGPGSIVLDQLIAFARSKKLNFYAEDTGDMLSGLRRCLHKHRLPGIKIFRFGYNEKRVKYSDHYLKMWTYPTNTVAYTTTHDTETLLAYLEQLKIEEVQAIAEKVGVAKNANLSELAVSIRQKVIDSPAKIVLIPLQDWLLTRDRINVPGTEQEIQDPNWRYQMDRPIEDLKIL